MNTHTHVKKRKIEDENKTNNKHTSDQHIHTESHPDIRKKDRKKDRKKKKSTISSAKKDPVYKASECRIIWNKKDPALHAGECHTPFP